MNAAIDVDDDDDGRALDDLAANGPVAKISAAVRLLGNGSLMEGVAGARRAAEVDDSPWVKMLSLAGRVRCLFDNSCSSCLKLLLSWSMPVDSCAVRGVEVAAVSKCSVVTEDCALFRPLLASRKSVFSAVSCPCDDRTVFAN